MNRQGESLADLDSNGRHNDEESDQFEGRQSTYDSSLCTSSLDESKVTEEQRETATSVGRELERDPPSQNTANLEVNDGNTGKNDEGMSSSVQ